MKVTLTLEKLKDVLEFQALGSDSNQNVVAAPKRSWAILKTTMDIQILMFLNAHKQ